MMTAPKTLLHEWLREVEAKIGDKMPHVWLKEVLSHKTWTPDMFCDYATPTSLKTIKKSDDTVEIYGEGWQACVAFRPEANQIEFYYDMEPDLNQFDLAGIPPNIKSLETQKPFADDKLDRILSLLEQVLDNTKPSWLDRKLKETHESTQEAIIKKYCEEAMRQNNE